MCVVCAKATWRAEVKKPARQHTEWIMKLINSAICCPTAEKGLLWRKPGSWIYAVGIKSLQTWNVREVFPQPGTLDFHPTLLGWMNTALYACSSCKLYKLVNYWCQPCAWSTFYSWKPGLRRKNKRKSQPLIRLKIVFMEVIILMLEVPVP